MNRDAGDAAPPSAGPEPRSEPDLAAKRVLDVRPAHAFRRGHLPGAVNIPEPMLPAWSALLPPRGRAFGVAGAGAEQASRVAQWLAARGWRGALPLEIPAEACTETGWARARLWEPAAYLERCEARLPADGLAIDLACGSGRNAVFLAEKPRRVLGVDILPDALELARLVRRQSPAGTGTVRFMQRDLTRARTQETLLAPGRFAIILCFRFLDRALLPRIERALRPGGCLVYETFLEAQRDARGKPRHPDHLLHPGELRRAFAELTLLDYREGVDEEGNHLASLCARR